MVFSKAGNAMAVALKTSTALLAEFPSWSTSNIAWSLWDWAGSAIPPYCKKIVQMLTVIHKHD
jgi:hypothetical protein